MFRDKKGQAIEDLYLFIIFLFVLAVGGVIATYIINQWVDNVQNVPTLNQSAAAMEAFEDTQALQAKWDYVILAIMLGFAVAVVILGYFVDVHSIFLPLYIIALIVGVVVSYILQYVWEHISTISQFTTITSTTFPITNHILTNFPLYFIIIGVLGMVATYAKENTGR